MTESQFITWLRGFTNGKAVLGTAEMTSLKQTLSGVTPTKSRYTSNSTNESFPSEGKQLLHD